jgi:hypothetical protein
VIDYAIIDVKKGSSSYAQVLMIVEDERTANEIAIELRRNGCRVTVQTCEMSHSVRFGEEVGLD